MSAFAVQIATSLLVAIVTSYLSVQLALRRFYQEKWWERRLNAYLEAIDALHTISKLGSEWIDETITNYEKSDEVRADDRIIFKKARNDLRRAVSIGELMLSEDAVKVLSLCQGHLDRININELGPLDYYEEMTHAACEALVETRLLIKRDLALEKAPRWIRPHRSN